MNPAPPEFVPSRPRDASVVILYREAPGGGREAFWVRRARTPAFPGAHAFPGGGLRREDAEVPVEGVPPEDARLLVAAVRELFEETGVLLARMPPTANPSSLRRGLVDEKLTFQRVLQSLGARIDPSLLAFANRWISPGFSPVRFDARFFLARLPAGQQAGVWGGELVSGEWIAPAEALRRWETGDALLHPPARHALECLARASDADLLAQLRDPPFVVDHVAQRIPMQRGVLVVPLLAPTLPPARHTSAYVLGDRELLVVDPGSPWPEEQEKLHALVRGLVAEGRTVKAILLTHHHPDHASGALAAKAALGAPIWAHARTAEQIAGVDRHLGDRERIALAGDFPMTLTVLHTPGHAAGHLCLMDERSGAAICGDLLSGASTVVIDPPEGDMELYLASLDRLIALKVRAIYPAHGDVMPDGPYRVEEALQHRRWREERILEALGTRPMALAEVTRGAYPDAPEAALPWAERSALASLLWLERRGRVERRGEQFALV